MSLFSYAVVKSNAEFSADASSHCSRCHSGVFFVSTVSERGDGEAWSRTSVATTSAGKALFLSSLRCKKCSAGKYKGMNWNGSCTT